MAGSGELLIKLRIKQHDLAGDLARPKSVQLIKIVYHHNFRGKSLGWCSYASAQCGKHYLLRCSRSHAWEGDQRPCLFTTDPMWHHYFFKAHLHPKLAQLISNILRGKIGLC
jgi:hypothetical protein